MKGDIRPGMSAAIDGKNLQEEADKITEGALDTLQTGMGIVGVAPGIGDVIDAMNSLISLARGNKRAFWAIPFKVVLLLPNCGKDTNITLACSMDRAPPPSL